MSVGLHRPGRSSRRDCSRCWPGNCARKLPWPWLQIRQGRVREAATGLNAVYSRFKEGFQTADLAAATTLTISEETAKTHVRNIIAKLGARDRTYAVTLAVRRGIMQL